LALPFFAITLFVSAFLLFIVEPMIGKMLLVPLGGTPQVWNTCMVFFQLALLAGYAYTHVVSSRLKLRQQLIIHGVLLLAPLLVLLPNGPFNISSWVPPAGSNPILATLLVLTIVVGLPFFVVSTSAPLLQRWFVNTGHPAAKDPYFLYGASNLGSLLALIAYPALIEPNLRLRGFVELADGTMASSPEFWSQPWVWTFLYVVLVGLMLGCAAMVWKAPPHVQLTGAGAESEAVAAEPPPAAVPQAAATAVTATPPAVAGRSTAIRRGSRQRGRGPHRPPPQVTPTAPPTPELSPIDLRRLEDVTWARRLRWVLLAAVPSSLMLGVITYISTDLSPIVMFWVVPLALYLLSFILVFLRWPIPWTGQPHTATTMVHLLMMVGTLYIFLSHQVSPIWRSISLSVLGFFFTAMFCHGELAKDRPGTKHLTEFYLWLSVGGALGGIFNGLIAPLVFWGVAELPIALVVSYFLRPYPNMLARMDKPTAAIVGTAAGMLVGVLLWEGFFIFLVLTVIGLVLGLLYQPTGWGDPKAGWTERVLVNLFPDVGAWAHAKGQELAGKPATEEPVSPRLRLTKGGQQNWYVLSYLFDIALPVLLLLLMWWLTSVNSTAVRRPRLPRPISSLEAWFFDFSQDSLGMSLASAYSLAEVAGVLVPYLLPVGLALFFFTRWQRIGLGIGAIILINAMYTSRSEGTLWRGRSYFGIIRVLEEDPRRIEPLREYEVKYVGGKTGSIPPFNYLMHGTTYHGQNYQSPPGLRRLATTYYHRLGPVGVIMQRFNWFTPAPDNPERDNLIMYTNYADARMPASVVALGGDVCSQLVNCWSEPPYACVGLGTGTMASYSHPFQHMTFYEIDNTIKSFHVPPYAGPSYFFNYVHDSLWHPGEKLARGEVPGRGAGIEIIMGDARQSLMREPDQHTGYYPHRESYYHCIELDAFSSDAIPVHLITREAIKMYFEKLVPNGVLMVHTSNRHVDLVSPVTDVADSLGLKWRVAKDDGIRWILDKNGQPLPDENGKPMQKFVRGLFGSEYVMLARRETDLVNGKLVKVLPDNTPGAQEAYDAGGERGFYLYRIDRDHQEHQTLNWYTPRAPGNRVWTDDYSNLLGVFRWGF
jgi:hypothetical protein